MYLLVFMYCYTLKCGSVSTHFYMSDSSDSSFSTIAEHYSKFEQKRHFSLVCCCVWHALRLPALLASVWQIGKYGHIQSDSQHIVNEFVSLFKWWCWWKFKKRPDFLFKSKKKNISFLNIRRIIRYWVQEWKFNDIFDYKRNNSYRKYWLLDIYKIKIVPMSMSYHSL